MRTPFRLSILHRYVGIDATADIELSMQAHEPRLAGLYQVIEDTVAHVLVECAFIAKRPDIQLPRLEFYARQVRDVLKLQGGEIRLAGFRTQTGKFRRADADGVIPVRVWIGKGLEVLAGLC